MDAHDGGAQQSFPKDPLTAAVRTSLRPERSMSVEPSEEDVLPA